MHNLLFDSGVRVKQAFIGRWKTYFSTCSSARLANTVTESVVVDPADVDQCSLSLWLQVPVRSTLQEQL